MTEEQKAAYVMARAAEAMSLTAGYIAENRICELRNEYPKYTLTDFEMLLGGIDHNSCISLFHDL